MSIPETTWADLRPDVDLEADAWQAIRALDTVNSVGAELTVRVRHGQATLTGYTRSEMLVPAIEQAVRGVSGDGSVVNHLVADSSLVRQIATALALDERTRDIPPGYHVVASLGHAAVVGHFASEATRAALSAVSHGVPGVRSIKIKAIDE